MSTFDAIIFDCDGVVVDSESLSCRCLAEVFADYGFPIAIDTVFDEFLGRSFSTVETYYERVSGDRFPAAFRVEYRRRLMDLFRTSLRPMPGVIELLAGLSVPFCLASSSDAERLAVTLAAAGVADYFDGRVFNAAMVEHGKPAPDLFLLAARSMGAEPRRCLVLEDTVPGIIAGKAAGMTAWGFVGGAHLAGRDGRGQLIGAGADRVVRSMREFAEGLEPARVGD